MDSTSSRCLILDIPPEIFEMVCSYLTIFDIVKLEALNKATNNRVKQSNFWRKRAEGINKKFNYGLIDQMLAFIKTTEIHHQQKLHKITIGVYGHLRRWMVALERNERKYLAETKTEISTFRNQGNSVSGKQARDWINKIVKSFIQLELYHSKMIQLLTLSDSLHLTNEEVDLDKPFNALEVGLAVDDAKIADILRSDAIVCDEIDKFSSWAYSKMTPTEDEVLECARIKASSIMSSLVNVFIPDLVEDGLQEDQN